MAHICFTLAWSVWIRLNEIPSYSMQIVLQCEVNFWLWWVLKTVSRFYIWQWTSLGEWCTKYRLLGPIDCCKQGFGRNICIMLISFSLMYVTKMKIVQLFFCSGGENLRIWMSVEKVKDFFVWSKIYIYAVSFRMR